MSQNQNATPTINAAGVAAIVKNVVRPGRTAAELLDMARYLDGYTTTGRVDSFYGQLMNNDDMRAAAQAVRDAAALGKEGERS